MKLLKTFYNSLNMKDNTLKAAHFHAMSARKSSLSDFTLKHSNCYIPLKWHLK